MSGLALCACHRADDVLPQVSSLSPPHASLLSPTHALHVDVSTYASTENPLQAAGGINDAAFLGDVNQLARCLSSGDSIDTRDADGWSPLFWAASRGHKAAVEFLIASKANVNLRTNTTAFALYFVACFGRMDVCEVLLRAGADRDMEYEGKSAAQWAYATRWPR